MSRLIFVNRYFFPDISATSQLLADLAVDQSARSHEVHVVTSRQLYDDATAALPAVDEYRGVTVHRVWTTRFGRANLTRRAVDYATFYLSCAFRLLRLVRAGDTIVAKTDPPLIAVVAAWVARRRRARLINWLQDVFPEIAHALGVRAATGVTGRAATALSTYALRTAAVNVVLGEAMARVVRTNVRIVENWSDGSLIRPIARAENPLRREWGLEDRFVVGYSGNMGRAHEFETILQACEVLRDHADVVFLFIGAGHQRDWIEREAKRRSVPNVAFRPYQPRESLALSLSVPDVHLVTLQPNLEGLIVPSKFYGVAAAGRPTLFIGDRAGEIAGIVEAEDCGRAISSGDPASLADAILALRVDPSLAEQMGRRARALFEARFDMPVALAKWDSVLHTLN